MVRRYNMGRVLIMGALILALAMLGFAPAGLAPQRAWALDATEPLAAQPQTQAQPQTPPRLHPQLLSAESVSLSTHEVTLSKNQNSFTVQISVNSSSAYAGAEFALQCAEGVVINGATNTATKSTAGPVVAGGLTWFSYFAGANSFSGTVTATVECAYTGTHNTSLVLEGITLYNASNNASGNTVTKENLALRETLIIKREGATNIPTPLDPPVNDPAAQPDGGQAGNANTRPGALVRLPLEGAGTNAAASNDAASVPLSSRAQGNSNASPLTNLNDAATPLASVPDSSTQAEAGSVFAYLLASPFLWVLAGLFAGCLLMLGYAHIQRKRERQDETLKS